MLSALRIYTPDDPVLPTPRTPGDTPQLWTIRQAFENESRPLLQRQRRSAGTVEKWKKAVWYWEQCRPDNPPLGAITRRDLDAFPEQVLQLAGAIRTTRAANQQLMYVNAILVCCADHLDAIPKGRPLPTEPPTRFRRNLTDQDLTDIYFATTAASYTTDPDLPAPLIWRALLVLLCSVGCRRSEALLMPRSALVRQVEFPDDLAGVDLDAQSPAGWLAFHTPKTRHRKGGRPLVLPCSRFLRDHLDALDQRSPHRDRLFPLGNHASTWRKEFQRIQTAAGITGEPYTFQELRKTANRRFRRAADREVARFMLGHQPRGVNATFYDDLTADAVAMLERCPWPRGFDAYTPGNATKHETRTGD